MSGVDRVKAISAALMQRRSAAPEGGSSAGAWRGCRPRLVKLSSAPDMRTHTWEQAVER